MTFDLSHFYFNWAGAIKVPAPCMYSHKIAELFMNLSKGDKRRMEEGDKAVDQLLTHKFNEYLHFL